MGKVMEWVKEFLAEEPATKAVSVEESRTAM